MDKTNSKSRIALPALALVVGSLSLSAQASFRTIDGSHNNRFDPTVGATDTPLLRAAGAHYADGVAAPAGDTRPSARAISNGVGAQPIGLVGKGPASDMLWQWGQFLDHDIDLTEGASPTESFDIPVPAGDPYFDPNGTGAEVIPLNRSVWTTDQNGVRQQLNQITAWIDASNVYGSDQARADELRRLDGSGKLKVSAHASGDLLPFNVNGFHNAPDDLDSSFFLAGDIRANEQVGLTALHTLWVREHNWLCDAIQAAAPGLHGDLTYQVARALVIAQMQQITYEEFLPLLLGPAAIPAYGGYDPHLDASIANEFSTASYRFGHSLLSPSLMRLDSGMKVIAEGNLALMDAFFDPARILDEGGIDPLLRGLATQVCNDVDTYVVDDIRNFLFGMPGSGGFDLASLNIQRGRDHGLPDYNTMREAYGLTRVTSFDEITSDATIANELQNLYGSVDDVDAWVGGLAEDHVEGALVGPLVRAVLSDQYLRLRDGDRFWYERYLRPKFRNWIDGQTLASVVKRNTSIGDELQDDLFRAPESSQ